MRLYHFIIHVFGKVLDLTSTSRLNDEYFKNNFYMFPLASKRLTERGLQNKCRFSGPVIIQGT